MFLIICGDFRLLGVRGGVEGVGGIVKFLVIGLLFVVDVFLLIILGV